MSRHASTLPHPARTATGRGGTSPSVPVLRLTPVVLVAALGSACGNVHASAQLTRSVTNVARIDPAAVGETPIQTDELVFTLRDGTKRRYGVATLRAEGDYFVVTGPSVGVVPLRLERANIVDATTRQVEERHSKAVAHTKDTGLGVVIGIVTTALLGFAVLTSWPEP
jgi:hypothetical protein